MKRFLWICFSFMIPAVLLHAQQVCYVMRVEMTDGSVQRIAVDDVNCITFETEEVFDPRQAVDLGLSVKWAACNIGADTPEGLGDLFSWAETAPKTDYSEANYSYFVNYSYEHIGYNITGVAKYDAATAQWGEPWRMPSLHEINQLMSCTWTPETLNGVKGYRVTGKNGNSIFLPAAGYQPGEERLEVGTQGYYWSASLNPDMRSSAYNINFRGYDAPWSASRAYGFSVRAVRD